MKRDIIGYTKIMIIAAILFSLPFLQQMGFIELADITVYGTVVFYSIAAIGLNVLLGYSGLVSLGTAGFMGLGAYIVGYYAESNFLLGIVIAIAVPVTLGAIVGLISLRLEGYYLAIATLGISEILLTVFKEFTAFTESFSGRSLNYRDFFPDFILELDFFGNPALTIKIVVFYIVSIVLIIVLFATHNIIFSSTGRALLAMKGSSPAAQAMGINLLKYKLTAFIIATLFASIAGMLYILLTRYSYPSTWNLTLSLQILAAVIIGGSRTILGPLLGSLVVFGLPDLVFKKIAFLSHISGISFIFTGVLIIVVILFYPNGLIYIGHDIKKLFKKVKK